MIYDIAVIGAGPSGLFVPFIAGMKNLSCIVFESLPFVGGQCAALYPEKPIYDIPAFPKILAGDLVENLKEQSGRFNPTICLEEGIVSYTRQDDLFVLHTSKGRGFKVRSIIFATGGGKFMPNRPPLEGIEAFEGKSVFYSVTSKNIFARKNVAIAGGGDSACDWAISLSEVANKVYFIHRREKFKASPESVQQLYELAELGKLEFIIPFQLKSLIGENGTLKAIMLEDFSNNERIVEVDFLLPFFGLMTDCSLVDVFNLEKQDGVIKVDPFTMKTNIDGIYAVGDIASYPNKLKLILSGFAEVATAVYSIKKYLNNGEVERFQYSTSMF